MFRLRCILLFMMLFLQAMLIYGQLDVENFEKLPEDLGLSNTSVVSINQDTRGFMWFGTWVGLYRYDGTSTKRYTVDSDDVTGLASNKISSLFVASQGDLFIGTLKGGLYKHRYATDDFIHIVDTANTNVLRTNIWSMYEDKQGSIWCATDKGIAIYSDLDGVLSNRDGFLKSDINSKRVHFIDDCGTDYIWAATDDGVFAFYLDGDGKIQEMGQYHFKFSGYTREESHYIFGIYSTSDPGVLEVFCKSGIVSLDFNAGFHNVNYKLLEGTGDEFASPRVQIRTALYNDGLIIGTQNGIHLYDRNEGISAVQALKNSIIRSLYRDSFGSLWIATENGLYIYNDYEKFIRNVQYRTTDEFNLDVLEHMTLNPVTQSVWLAWQSGVISRIDRGDDGYDYSLTDHYSIRHNDAVFKNRISQISSDAEGDLWVATQGSGVLRIDNPGSHSEYIETSFCIDHNKGLIDNYIMSIAVDHSAVWMGTWNNGLFRYIRNADEVQSLSFERQKVMSLKDVPVVFILQHPLKEGRLILGTRGNGVFIVDVDTNDSEVELITHLCVDSLDGYNLASNFITDMVLEKDRLYIASENGLDILDLVEDRIIEHGLEGDLSDQIIQSVIVTKEKQIWLSTYNNGLIEIKPNESNYAHKLYRHSILTNYTNASHVTLDDGTFLLGGAHGFTRLNPKFKSVLTKAPIPFITDFRIGNVLVKPGENVNGDIKFDRVLNESPKVCLSYNDKAVSISLSALHTREHQGIRYAYMLEGFHEDWIFLNRGERQVYFTNLPYDDMVFKYRAANSDGVWSDIRELQIAVSPPWWLSAWAYVVYSMALIGLIYLIVQIFIFRTRYSHELKLERMERMKSEELNQLKLKFYTSISHELRTPLTMIISPIEQLLRNAKDSENKRHYEFIYKNANKLLSLVNKLLDFRKHDSGKIDINLMRLDIVEFASEIVSGFKEIASKRSVSLNFHSRIDRLYMAFSEEEMEKLFNNLISNAIKYTSDGNDISIDLSYLPEDNEVEIRFKDTGKGIDEADLDKIFNRFYQGREHATEGYGLGLAIVRSVVDLHEGSIDVKSQKGQGTTFIVRIPTTLQVTENTEFTISSGHDEIQSDASMHVENVDGPETGQMVLVVEDNEDIREYLESNLGMLYDVHLARDGAEGLNMAQKLVPDLIISDIAMPVMDGLQLCKALKQSDVTSHIPVMLLTARTSIEYKLDGFDYGINAFVTKPFNMSLLMKRIKSLLEYHELLKSKYKLQVVSSQDVESGDDSGDTPNESAFIAELKSAIFQELGNSDLTIEDIAGKLNMTQNQLYRKLKAVTGTTPNVLLREIRLTEAARLIVESDLTIAEITYNVGFNDLKYFRKKFKQMYACTPSDFKQRKIST